MTERRVYQICVVRTEDGGIAFAPNHQPLLTPKGDQPLRLPLLHQAGETKWEGRIYLCARCGVLYVDATAITFTDKIGPLAPGGNA